MNFSYGVIVVVGVLVAISLGLIAAAPNDIIEPRITSDDEKLTVCTLQWDPMCGVDGETYGNLCMLDAADVKLDHKGECMAVQPETTDAIEIKDTITVSESLPIAEEEPETTDVVEIEDTVTVSQSEMPAKALPIIISLPEGSGIPGCEETNECFIPYEVSVAVGTTVTWSNDDTAAHTVTSGTISSSDGLFDSSIFMAGKSFEFTFNDAGTYDYFCMVHPWMTGIVQVS
ncbi:MAG: plastocyanin/azurin family copper-binding protein [Nitrosopumilus sp.]|nr:plastocyanin/azurin family copper-binding protein [Nitrosopumilus sp.]